MILNIHTISKAITGGPWAIAGVANEMIKIGVQDMIVDLDHKSKNGQVILSMAIDSIYVIDKPLHGGIPKCKTLFGVDGGVGISDHVPTMEYSIGSFKYDVTREQLPYLCGDKKSAIFTLPYMGGRFTGKLPTYLKDELNKTTVDLLNAIAGLPPSALYAIAGHLQA